MSVSYKHSVRFSDVRFSEPTGKALPLRPGEDIYRDIAHWLDKNTNQWIGTTEFKVTNGQVIADLVIYCDDQDVLDLLLLKFA